MTKDEALKMALEALEANQPVNYCMNNNGEKFPMMQEDPFRFERNTKAITAIKEALAQPEHIGFMDSKLNPIQRTWVGLRDDEIYSVLENLQIMHQRPPTMDSRVIFAQAIEAKLKEKNT